MTSKLTREERVQSLYGLKIGQVLNPSDIESIKMLARMALAAMDSEPVAEVVSIYGDPEAFGEREIRPLVGIQQMPYGTKLYRHAQPAPVVSADLLHSAASAIEDLLTTKDRTGAGVWFDLPFKLRSAANAQPAPVVPKSISVRQAISALESAGAVTTIGQAYKMGWNACRSAMLQAKSLTTINPAPTLVSLPKNAKSLTGNSPGIPDGYVMVPVEPNGDMLAAAQDAYGETDGDIASTLRAAMLSGGKS